jgi:hypothetical protein
MTLASRASVPAGPSPSAAWLPTKASSMMASLRRVSRYLAVSLMKLRSAAIATMAPRAGSAWHPTDGMKDRSSPLQEAQFPGPGDGLAT